MRKSAWNWNVRRTEMCMTDVREWDSIFVMSYLLQLELGCEVL